ncbi:benzoate/H(+) symporter BenE family transporter [Brevibacillus choshinensis]|uniref:Benzoate/H(+) symporter BenE family transporter n=1 Tax=Brevibacillus choshinensis TaxID=54911 RepID=A0ABX7FKJ9_BRECH|nr:benzoate/H(+) symporter BenE family transporter [Brevibacillus choshinensis]QRG66733.1 benzoate/H(+) symporter BenE family transporter [Brevibacillus choshinensis]
MVSSNQRWSFSSIKNIPADFSVSALIVGLIATMVSYAGPLLIVFQAAKAASLSDALLSSWIWAISIGSGVTAIVLSIRYRTPVITAWSTPGAVLLVTSLSVYSYGDAIGAYLFSAVVITLLGVSGLFSTIMRYVPPAITTAMLAGILLSFGVQVFVSMQQLPALALPMMISYLLAKRWSPRYAVVLSLLVGLLTAFLLNRFELAGIQIAIVEPVFTMPAFSLDAIIGLGIPLCIVTMASQNAPGIGVLQADGYDTPTSPLITTTGAASLLLAPFGAHGINLAAITAAICTGKEAHPDPAKRYIAGIACGAFYLVFGMFGATIASVFSAFPKELIAVIAGLALFGSLGSSLASAMSEATQRESALITFLVTISGITIGGIGSAFWGLVAGVITNALLAGDVRRWLGRNRRQPS